SSCSTCSAVPGSGTPTSDSAVRTSSGRSHRHDACTVVSVIPYMFTSWVASPTAAYQRSTSPRSSASPANSTYRRCSVDSGRAAHGGGGVRWHGVEPVPGRGRGERGEGGPLPRHGLLGSVALGDGEPGPRIRQHSGHPGLGPCLVEHEARPARGHHTEDRDD